MNLVLDCKFVMVIVMKTSIARLIYRENKNKDVGILNINKVKIIAGNPKAMKIELE